jgi:biopolymer transport protein ExbD
MNAHQLETASPLIEMNTTPLIDVMLVLLIMFIITIPMQTHAVKFDLPGQVPPTIHPDRTSNLLVVKADGSLRWNGLAIGGDELSQELAITRQMAPQPELHLQPEPAARHGDVDRVLAIIKREQISKFGFVGNEKYLNTF